MEYLLDGIEIWVYSNKKYPELILEKYLDCYIGGRYTVGDFSKLEKKVSKYLEKKGYIVVSIMNPLYLDSKSTVINFDVLTKKDYNSTKKIKNKNTKNIFLPGAALLMKKYETRLYEIFNTGEGSLKKIREDGIFFSEDLILQKIEKKIAKFIEKNKKCFLKFLKENNSSDLLKCAQWTKKDNNLVSIFIEKIKNGGEEEKNISLLQLIPVVKNFSSPQQKKLLKILDNIMFFPSSCVRNKALSIIMEMLREAIAPSKDLIKFIKLISRTKQINCSYPAKKILKTLNVKVEG